MRDHSFSSQPKEESTHSFFGPTYLSWDARIISLMAWAAKVYQFKIEVEVWYINKISSIYIYKGGRSSKVLFGSLLSFRRNFLDEEMQSRTPVWPISSMLLAGDYGRDVRTGMPPLPSKFITVIPTAEAHQRLSALLAIFFNSLFVPNLCPSPLTSINFDASFLLPHAFLYLNRRCAPTSALDSLDIRSSYPVSTHHFISLDWLQLLLRYWHLWRYINNKLSFRLQPCSRNSTRYIFVRNFHHSKICSCVCYVS